MNEEKNILLAFYGDDLTGSTDALEAISLTGAKAVLFLSPPSKEQLASYPGLRVYGVAGLTRSLPTEQMEYVLKPAFSAMRDSGAKLIHYKVCSTFDSSSQIGSIGRAIDCGGVVFQNKIVPVLGGTPALGRYCVFGNLFAQMGIGSHGKIYRLDRHPSMSQHPVTPAFESDLRLHLGYQTEQKIGLVDLIKMKNDVSTWMDGIQETIVLLDALDELQLDQIGEWMMTQQEDGPLFMVGSSAVETSLGNYWNKTGMIANSQLWPAVDKAEPLLVLSGSCSPITKTQIAFSVANGFVEVPLESTKVKGNVGEGIFIGCDIDNVVSSLMDEKSVIIHTGQLQDVDQSDSAEVLGNALGKIGRIICERIKLKRVVVAGGDTSSYAGRAMGIEALEMLAPLLRGAPLCKAYAPDSPLHGIEVNFKGGQVGGENYFVLARDGYAEKHT